MGHLWAAVLLLLLTGCRGFQLSVDVRPPHGQLAASVLFSLSTNPPQTYASILWTVNGSIITQCIRMNCITSPPYQTRINDNFTAATGSLQLNHLTLSDTGEYRITLQSTESVERTSVVWFGVYEMIRNATITGPTDSLISVNQNFSLTCKALGGSSLHLSWLKDGQVLSASDRIIISPDNSSMEIKNLNQRDTGTYQCKVTNPISEATDSYFLHVAFGPDDASITGPSYVKIDEGVQLKCTAPSLPVSDFSWMFNGTETSTTTDTYYIKQASFNDTGSYVCTANNLVTGLKATSPAFTLVVGDEVINNQALPAGAIAGIVIGVLLALGVVIAAVVMLMKKKRLRYPTTNQKAPSTNEQNKKEETDITYAYVYHMQKPQSQEVKSSQNSNSGPTDESAPKSPQPGVIYSQVKAT